MKTSIKPISRFVSQTSNKHQYTDFEIWFAGCVQYCVNNPSNLWDKYRWSLKTSKVWKQLFDEGLTEELAVKKHFKFNKSLN